MISMMIYLLSMMIYQFNMMIYESSLYIVIYSDSDIYHYLSIWYNYHR